MRHKYETRGIVLSRASVGEASTFVILLTSELGLVRALAQSLRRSGAKLAPALATFAESSVVLVRGRDGWRISGAVLGVNRFAQMRLSEPRARAAHISDLIMRLVAGEQTEIRLFPITSSFFSALSELPEDVHEAAEVLAALRILSVLGLDIGEIPGDLSDFTPALLTDVIKNRSNYIARVNRGIEASGL